MIERIKYLQGTYQDSYSVRNNINKTLNMNIKVDKIIKRSAPEKFSIVLEKNKLVLDSLTLKYLTHLNRDLKSINNYTK